MNKRNLISKNTLLTEVCKIIEIKKIMRKNNIKKNNSKSFLKKINFLFLIMIKHPIIEVKTILRFISKLPAMAQIGIESKSKKIKLFGLIFFLLICIIKNNII